MKNKDNKNPAHNVELSPWARDYVWHPFTQMKNWENSEPLIIDRGDGIYLIDIDGNRYIDGISSMWTNVHGHNHPKINDALKTQIDKISHSTLLGFSNVPSILLAKKLVEISPSKLNKVFYSDNGSTAVEIGLKMAYQFWKHKNQERPLFIHLDRAYHGDTLGAVSVGGIDLFHETFKSLTFPSISVPTPSTFQSTKNIDSKTALSRAITEFEKTLQIHKNKIAAVIVEPIVQGAGGMLIAEKGFLKAIETLTEKYDTLLIADEVMTGFGRTGKMWACQHENVTPDILCLAKGLTAGYLPLAATLATDRIYEAFLGDRSEMKTFFHGHTFTGNQLGCTVALANIEIFESENLIDKIQPTIEHLKDRLREFQNFAKVNSVRSCGLIGAIDLSGENIGIRVCAEALKRGAILRPLANTIVIMPPLQISLTELDTLIDIIRDSIIVATEIS